MLAAIAESRRALGKGEVPVGCVFVLPAEEGTSEYTTGYTL